MKVKIEFTNGNIEVTKVEFVAIHRGKGVVFIRRFNYRFGLEHELEKVSRVTVDNEIIYDFMGRKERYKKEEAKDHEQQIKKYCFGIE